MSLGDLWCCEWGCCESDSDKNFKEPPKKKVKGKGGKKLTGSKWFVSPTYSVEMDETCKGFVPKNTEKTTNWAVGVFEQWKVERNRATSAMVKCVLPTCCSALPRYRSITGCRGLLLKLVERMDMQPYPPTSISNLLAGLCRECQIHDPNCPNFMNRKDPMFKELNGALYK